MKRFAIVLTGFLALPLSLGCQRDKDLNEKLDEILKAVETKCSGGGAPGARPSRPERPRPNPTAVYSVPVGSAPYKGPKEAKVTIVKAFEFACPFCERSSHTMDQLIEDYKGDVKVAYKHFIVHPPSATVPAQAACAAGEQGKWAEMEKILWEKAFKARKFDKDHITTLAKEAGLDMGKFEKDMAGVCQSRVRQDQSEVAKVGTTGTPAFYINGRFLSGARPPEQFKAIIDEELKKANARISKGEATVSNYYEKFVVKEGKKTL